ncbi:methylenetetrahydrofolate dehydrogenase (NADP+) / methenyltetrahydrofolate cyclohydrolase [Planifilum fulgidum]|uniref:Bifunctional protein FolD n=1 Tax=Planifilum fulgidum TaxID=201973 RepID=A0A1I2L8A2_9BACL|nr:bifunctional methylenetetrahydrofolate dehydrogenase/methenyltetrahydrofolate cyclohydrolase FolD [Planifilum fulgidum]MBO2495826.1 bifunctional methylenetetrahydrofolate dehydrogenase/methenyltetrahydrofolate cyclohydrolase FolD [Bacillota bacterium]SFF73697.1 methylenetetrahydrofolate dehydrogenase (NADP+) / methenyltetrahydrofolate cyclohydrolase [Planifilum fulgidum]
MSSAQLIDGKSMAQDVKRELASRIKRLESEAGVRPGLAVILVGDDPASEVYVRGKIRDCRDVGIRSEWIRLPDSNPEEDLLRQIDRLNEDPRFHGILVQLPLPRHISAERVIHRIRPEKDVDGFHPINVGKMVIGQEAFLPCTPYGIMEMLRRSGISVAGKHAVVVGRSNIVGKPVSILLQQADATVTLCHSKTRDLAAHTRRADILVVAVGKARVIGPEHVKPGAVVIDVGINRTEEGRLTGDVDFEAVRSIASHITPVPGGVGPMTRAMLLVNTVRAAERTAGIGQG